MSIFIWTDDPYVFPAHLEEDMVQLAPVEFGHRCWLTGGDGDKKFEKMKIKISIQF